jgi:uncharacterized membrane protein
MLFANWIIGTQFLGMIFLIAGYIQKYFPPQKINALYGYRTTASMQNQQNWVEGNRYSTMLTIKYAWIMLIAGILINFALAQLHMGTDAFVLTKVALMIAGAVTVLVIMIRRTELHLKNITPKNP